MSTEYPPPAPRRGFGAPFHMIDYARATSSARGTLGGPRSEARGQTAA